MIAQLYRALNLYKVSCIIHFRKGRCGTARRHETPSLTGVGLNIFKDVRNLTHNVWSEELSSSNKAPVIDIT